MLKKSLAKKEEFKIKSSIFVIGGLVYVKSFIISFDPLHISDVTIYFVSFTS